MHMVSRKDLNSAEVETVSVSQSPTTVMTANGDAPTKEEATMYGNLSHDLPKWLLEFSHGLVDESVPEHRDASSSSHELPSEPRAKVESGKHSIFTHFPKDRNCDICLRKKYKSSCSKRTGTVVHIAEHLGDLSTPDHKVLIAESESRHNHRYAVVVQDLATQWIQSYPCKA